MFLLLLIVALSDGQYVLPMPPSCGGCSPSCAPRICQPQMMCPPPAPCPPQFCPPPPICPPPPLPAPCPPPTPPCASRPMFYQPPPQVIYQPMPMSVSYGGGCGAAVPRIPAQNDCCCGCSTPCKYRGKLRAAGVKISDPSCSSKQLKELIDANISDDATDSKRKIQKVAEESLGHIVNVICGKGEFSYIAHTEIFCQSTSGDITCYAFKPL